MGNGYGYGYNINGYGYGYGYGYDYGGNKSGGGGYSNNGSLYAVPKNILKRIARGGRRSPSYRFYASPKIISKFGEITSKKQKYITKNPGIRRLDNSYVFLKNKNTKQQNFKSIIEVLSVNVEEEKISIDTSGSMRAKKMEIVISSEFLRKIYNSENNVFKLDVKTLTATKKEERIAKKQNLKILGSNAIKIKMTDKNNQVINNYQSPIKISFDLSGVKQAERYKLYQFDEVIKAWKLVGDGGSFEGNTLSAEVDHLSLFSIVRKFEKKKFSDLKYDQKNKYYLRLDNIKPSNKINGRFVIKVEDKGESWYINPVNNKAYFLGGKEESYEIIKNLAIGIKGGQLKNIVPGILPGNKEDSDGDGLGDMLEKAIGTDLNSRDSDNDGYDDKLEIENGYNPLGRGKIKVDRKFVRKNKGKIFLQVENKGRIWYINPSDGKKYYIENSLDVLSIVENLGVGISNADFENAKK